MWKNPMQSQEEQHAILNRLLEDTDDPAEIEVLELLKLADDGRYHIQPDGRIFLTDWVVRQN